MYSSFEQILTLYQIAKSFVNEIEEILSNKEKLDLTSFVNGNRIEESATFFSDDENVIYLSGEFFE